MPTRILLSMTTILLVVGWGSSPSQLSLWRDLVECVCAVKDGGGGFALAWPWRGTLADAWVAPRSPLPLLPPLPLPL
ncbi:hypothetical protein NL676_021359 [Syzygium grande]|nr:hypothetical protein NL676_021359 [Syzygium grande]